MENKSPAVVSTTPSRFGTRSLKIASRRSVDWQSPDCESQILMVPSQLPLAICFPSGLHATERTLKLREVITRINRTREKKIAKTYNFECPVSVDHRRHVKRMFLNLLHFCFARIYSFQKSYLFEWLLTPDTQTGTWLIWLFFKHID